MFHYQSFYEDLMYVFNKKNLNLHVDGLVQERCNSIANALELLSDL